MNVSRSLDRLNCGKRLDADDNGRMNLTDAVVVLGFVFGQERAPPEPFRACGPDPTPDDLNCQGSNCP